VARIDDKKFNVVKIGLGFGAEFIPIYRKHPLANLYTVCQRTESKFLQVSDAFRFDRLYGKYEDVLADPKVDIVHINTPIPDHAPQTIAAPKAGKHVMCTVPMATTIEECQQIVELVQKTGLKYMMADLGSR
jgi:predicted dehydrogenase